MGDNGANSHEQTQVRRAAKLLEKRSSGDTHTRIAVERKLKEMPEHIVAKAKAHGAKPAAHKAPAHKAPATTDADGGVTFEPLEINVTPADQAQYSNAAGLAMTSIGREVDRFIEAVQKGHEEGYANFRVWYRGWEHAKESSSNEIASKICGFLLEKGLAVIFPEEEVFIVILKEAAKKGWDLAADHLGKVDKGDIESFLDKVWAAEMDSVNKLLDAHDKFFHEHTADVDALVANFIGQREAGWTSTEELHPETLEMLHSMGIGVHGSAASKVIAERVLAAHIDSVLHSDEGTMQIAGGANADTIAKIEALKEMQKLPGLDNREEMWDLERSLPDMLRSMVDINAEPAIMLHIRLGIDQDDAEKIVASRNGTGPFKSSDELLSRKLMSADDLKRVEWRIVCH